MEKTNKEKMEAGTAAAPSKKVSRLVQQGVVYSSVIAGAASYLAVYSMRDNQALHYGFSDHRPLLCIRGHARHITDE